MRGAAGGSQERQGGRLRALDGLRGLAALMVLMHHALLSSAPQLANSYVGLPQSSGTVTWLLTYTPLHLLWGGPEAVIVFFVLSGFVLTLPVARGGRLRIGSYYPSRFLRLYLPVWGALAVAAGLHSVVSHHTVDEASWWLNGHAQALQAHAGLLDASLFPGAGDWGFTTVLWSLRWEVLFSLLLPLWLLAPLHKRAWSLGAALVCCLALLRAGGALGGAPVAQGSGGSGPLLGSSAGEYLLELPPFLLGSLMAFRYEAIERLAAALRERTARNIVAQLVVGAACVGCLSANWWLPGAESQALLVALGACLAVLAALTLRTVRGFLESTPLQWTGKRSYSLYLVHEPLIVALAFALGGRPSTVLFVALAVPLALGAAAAFFALVESPSHRLARAWVRYRESRRRDALVTAEAGVAEGSA